jgi:hypothetical protein
VDHQGTSARPPAAHRPLPRGTGCVVPGLTGCAPSSASTCAGSTGLASRGAAHVGVPPDLLAAAGAVMVRGLAVGLGGRRILQRHRHRFERWRRTCRGSARRSGSRRPEPGPLR